jgi:hypothetical protein
MALNVNWNWRMPTVGDPNGPANSNLAGLQQGANAVAQGIQRAKEREQNQQQFDAKLAQDQQQFTDQMQLRRDQIQQENLFKNRDYWEQKRLNDERIKQVEAELERKRQQQEWMNKMYAEYFGDVSPELKALREKYGNSSDAALVMNGLNPLFMK